MAEATRAEGLVERWDRVLLAGPRDRLTLTVSALQAFQRAGAGRNPDPALTAVLGRVEATWASHIRRLTLRGPHDEGSAPGLGGFSACRHLRLRRVPLDLEVESLSRQLESCLIEACRPPRPSWDVWLSHQPWPALTTLALTRCDLTRLDAPLFRLCPRLVRLDLSFNRLTSWDQPLIWGTLETLCLNFNRLSVVPDLARVPVLKSLGLAYNRLEHLDGLADAGQLRILDVSWNLLLHPDVLAPISRLPWLRDLGVAGNPFAPSARTQILAWIHPNVDAEAFWLDAQPLRPSERSLLGLARALDLDPLAVVDGPGYDRTNTGYAPGLVPNRSRPLRPRVLREVVIAEPSADDEHPVPTPETAEEPSYLQTKRRIDSLRATHGQAGWLHAVGGQELHSILGLTRPTPPSLTAIGEPEARVAKLQDIENFIAQAAQQLQKSHPHSAMSSLDGECQLSQADLDPPERMPVVLSTHEPRHEPRHEPENGEDSQGDDPLDELQMNFYSQFRSEDDADDSRPEHFLSIAVRNCAESDEVSSSLTLKLTNDAVLEVSQTGVILTQWPIYALHHVEMTQTMPPTLEFAFKNTNGHEVREYEMSELDLAKVLDWVKPILSGQQTSPKNLAMQCMKCQRRFQLNGQQATGKVELQLGNRSNPLNRLHLKFLPACPHCQSGLVVQDPGSGLDEDAHSPAVSVGIPVCEDLAFATPSTSPTTSIEHPQSSTPKRRQTFSPAQPVASIEKLLESSSLSSSSDISVLSNPSLNSIQILTKGNSSDVSKITREPSEISLVEDELVMESKPMRPSQLLTSRALGNRDEVEEASSFTSAAYYTCTSDMSLNSANPSRGEPLRSSSACTSPRIRKISPMKKVASESQICNDIIMNTASPDVYGTSDKDRSKALNTNQLSGDQLKRIAQEIYPNVISWNYNDFTFVDHRVKLHCELNLCQEREECILLVAKGLVKLPDRGRLFSGVLVFSNRSVFTLKIRGCESENVEEWMKLEDTRPVHQLKRTLLLARGQGLGLEFQTANSTAYIIFGDSIRTHRFKDQLDECLLNFVRSTPLGHRDISSVEEGVILDQLAKHEPVQDHRDLIQFVNMQYGQIREGGKCIPRHSSLLLTRNEFVVFDNFFQWIFEDSRRTLRSLYQSRPEVMTILFRDVEPIHIFLASEGAILQVLKSVQELWEVESSQCFEQPIPDVRGSCWKLKSKQIVLRDLTGLEEISFVDSIGLKEIGLPHWSGGLGPRLMVIVDLDWYAIAQGEEIEVGPPSSRVQLFVDQTRLLA
eukprot:maker-scaffold1724_size29877-snap-gene-0.11 protein:Tk08326 transcript:maker-scaffold1724_size29877-snap-gene-0.11-mRNA-1 annotation:"serine threonine kinase 11-interacting protein"